MPESMFSIIIEYIRFSRNSPTISATPSPSPTISHYSTVLSSISYSINQSTIAITHSSTSPSLITIYPPPSISASTALYFTVSQHPSHFGHSHSNSSPISPCSSISLNSDSKSYDTSPYFMIIYFLHSQSIVPI